MIFFKRQVLYIAIHVLVFFVAVVILPSAWAWALRSVRCWALCCGYSRWPLVVLTCT